MPKITWQGILAFEGVSTNEAGSLGGRFIDEGALEWSTPFPLRIVLSDVGQHDGAMVAGSVDEVWRDEADPRIIRGRGRFDADSAVGLEAARLASEKFKRGISIDPGNADRVMRLLDAQGNELDPTKYQSEDDLPEGAHIQDAMTSARIRGATIVDIPAFEGAMIEQVIVEADEDEEPIEGEDMVAAAMSHDGAMVALVPSDDDASRLAVDGFEPADVLHLTLAFLGPASDIPDEDRDFITDSLSAVLDEMQFGPFTGSAWAAANFNPTEEPAATYLVGGKGFAPFREAFVGLSEQALAERGIELPEQHEPWIPHVTVGYGELDASDLDGFGEVTFDRLRIAFGEDDVRDIPLEHVDEEPEPVEEDDNEPEGMTAAATFSKTCEFCDNPATNAVVWADGRAYIPTCDDHLAEAERVVVEDNEDEVTEVIAISDGERVSDDDPDAVTAAAVAPHSTQVAPKESDWDGNTAEKALPTGEEPSFYRQFYAFQAPETDGTAKDHWHYIHHHVSGSGSDAQSGAASLEAAHAIIGLLNGARGVDPVATGEDRKAVYDHMARHMRDGGEEPPPLKNPPESVSGNEAASAGRIATMPPIATDPDCDLEELTSLTASAVDIPALPASHFDPIDFAAPTPLTVDEETGRVYGHVAMSSICHVGYPKCVTMPKSASSLRYFHTGVVRLDDGTDLATGRITVHGAHAALALDWRSAMAHYDNASTTVADVVAYEDDHGIAVTGHVRPGTPPELVHAFRGSTPSGDWRRIGSAAELINIHMVNSPGFPVYRTEGDRLEATITASAAPARFTDDPPPTTPDPALAAQFGDDIAARVVTILNAQAEAEALANEVSEHYDLAADNIAKAVRP